MYQNTPHAAVSTVRVHATVTDTTGVQRVLTLLTGRELLADSLRGRGGGRRTLASSHPMHRQPA